MRKKKHYLCFLSFLIFLSCHKEEDNGPYLDIDYYPVEFVVNVQNTMGNNLLDSETEGNILDEEMYFIYNERRYEIIQGLPEPIYSMEMHTRALITIWYGGYISKYTCRPDGYPGSHEFPPTLFIGEFPGDTTGEWSIELHIGEKEYELGYKTYYMHELDVKRKYFLDGEEHEGPVYTFTL